MKSQLKRRKPELPINMYNSVQTEGEKSQSSCVDGSASYAGITWKTTAAAL